MVDPEKLKYCKEKGRHSGIGDSAWRKCVICGMWWREVLTIQEREDTPPEEEQSQFGKDVAADDDSLDEFERHLLDEEGDDPGPDDEGSPGVRVPKGKPKPRTPMKDRAEK